MTACRGAGVAGSAAAGLRPSPMQAAARRASRFRQPLERRGVRKLHRAWRPLLPIASGEKDRSVTLSGAGVWARFAATAAAAVSDSVPAATRPAHQAGCRLPSAAARRTAAGSYCANGSS